MVYGDLQFFDIIIFAGIAIFLVFRLRSVLGKRTGYEKAIERPAQSTQKEKQTTEIKKQIPELKDEFIKLKIAYEHLNNFDHKQFLEGAKIAFETIINAFNKGDKKTLKTLLSKDVFKKFEEAIDSKNIDPNYQFFSLNIDSIEDVTIDSENIQIRIKFISEQFKNDDESTVVKKLDAWTFKKPIKSLNPNWLLCST